MQFSDLIQYLDQLDGWGIRDHPADVRAAAARAIALRDLRPGAGESLTAIEGKLAGEIATGATTIEDAIKVLTKHRRAADDAAAAAGLLRAAERAAEREAVAAFKRSGPELHALLREVFEAARQRFEGGSDAEIRTLEGIWELIDTLRSERVLHFRHARSGLELRYRHPEAVPLDRTLSPAQRMREAIASGADPSVYTGSQIVRNEVPTRRTAMSA